MEVVPVDHDSPSSGPPLSPSRLLLLLYRGAGEGYTGTRVGRYTIEESRIDTHGNGPFISTFDGNKGAQSISGHRVISVPLPPPHRSKAMDHATMHSTRQNETTHTLSAASRNAATAPGMASTLNATQIEDVRLAV